MSLAAGSVGVGRRAKRETPMREQFYWGFSHDVTKNSNQKNIDPLEMLTTSINTNFRSEWALSFVIDYARISKLLLDAAKRAVILVKNVTYLGKFGHPNSLRKGIIRKGVILMFLSSSSDKFTLL